MRQPVSSMTSRWRALQRRLSCVDAAARKLDLGARRLLQCQQDPFARQSDDVDAVAMPVAPAALVSALPSAASACPVLTAARGTYMQGPRHAPRKNPCHSYLKSPGTIPSCPFQLDRSDIRGRVARLDGTLDRILAQHDYPAGDRGAGGRGGAADRADRPDDQASLEAQPADPRERPGAPDRDRLLSRRRKRVRRRGYVPMPASTATGCLRRANPFPSSARGTSRF